MCYKYEWCLAVAEIRVTSDVTSTVSDDSAFRRLATENNDLAACSDSQVVFVAATI